MNKIRNYSAICFVFYNSAGLPPFGFDDAFIYKELDLPHKNRTIPMVNLMPDEAKEAFADWECKDDKIPY